MEVKGHIIFSLLELFSPNKGLVFPNFKSHMEPRDKWRLSFIIKVVFWARYTVFEIRLIRKQRSEWLIRMSKMNNSWGSLICPQNGNGVLLLLWLHLSSSLHYESCPLNVRAAHTEGQLDPWVWFSAWTLFLSFGSRYHYVLPIQVGSSSY